MMLASRAGRMLSDGEGEGVGEGVMGAKVATGTQRAVSRSEGRGWMSTGTKAWVVAARREERRTVETMVVYILKELEVLLR